MPQHKNPTRRRVRANPREHSRGVADQRQHDGLRIGPDAWLTRDRRVPVACAQAGAGPNRCAQISAHYRIFWYRRAHAGGHRPEVIRPVEAPCARSGMPQPPMTDRNRCLRERAEVAQEVTRRALPQRYRTVSGWPQPPHKQAPACSNGIERVQEGFRKGWRRPGRTSARAAAPGWRWRPPGQNTICGMGRRPPAAGGILNLRRPRLTAGQGGLSCVPGCVPAGAYPVRCVPGPAQWPAGRPAPARRRGLAGPTCNGTCNGTCNACNGRRSARQPIINGVADRLPNFGDTSGRRFGAAVENPGSGASVDARPGASLAFQTVSLGRGALRPARLSVMALAQAERAPLLGFTASLFWPRSALSLLTAHPGAHLSFRKNTASPSKTSPYSPMRRDKFWRFETAHLMRTYSVRSSAKRSAKSAALFGIAAPSKRRRAAAIRQAAVKTAAVTTPGQRAQIYLDGAWRVTYRSPASLAACSMMRAASATLPIVSACNASRPSLRSR